MSIFFSFYGWRFSLLFGWKPRWRKAGTPTAGQQGNTGDQMDFLMRSLSCPFDLSRYALRHDPFLESPCALATCALRSLMVLFDRKIPFCYHAVMVGCFGQPFPWALNLSPPLKGSAKWEVPSHHPMPDQPNERIKFQLVTNPRDRQRAKDRNS